MVLISSAMAPAGAVVVIDQSTLVSSPVRSCVSRTPGLPPVVVCACTWVRPAPCTRLPAASAAAATAPPAHTCRPASANGFSGTLMDETVAAAEVATALWTTAPAPSAPATSYSTTDHAQEACDCPAKPKVMAPALGAGPRAVKHVSR